MALSKDRRADLLIGARAQYAQKGERSTRTRESQGHKPHAPLRRTDHRRADHSRRLRQQCRYAAYDTHAASSVAASGALTTAPTTVPRPPESAQPVTILGVIRPGALPGCNVLHADNGTHYVLLYTTDPPRNIPIEVIGVLDTSLVSYCNSGQPLHVQRISQP